MRLILNGINGRYLREILENAAPETDVVEAAVAYSSHEELFAWCQTKNIPLRYWGRIDDGNPVSVQILRNFLRARSPNFACKLLTHFHAKVIWWHGYGAYIGSANLSQAAWYSNIGRDAFSMKQKSRAQTLMPSYRPSSAALMKRRRRLQKSYLRQLKSVSRSFNA